MLNLTAASVKYIGLRLIRDPTRGGIATVCAELHRATGMGVRLLQTQLPVREQVQSVCDMLGYDPMYLACEGRVVAIVEPSEAQEVLACWRNLDEGREAAIIGQMDASIPYVLMETEIGGERILEELEDDPLPRIC